MKNLLLLASLSVLLTCCNKNEDTGTPEKPGTQTPLEGPVQRPESGYGSDGTHTVAKVSFASPLYAGKSVEVFYPSDMKGPVPTIFYSHPYGGEESAYNIGLYEFIAKKGYAVVFAPYPTVGVTVEERYSTLWESFTKTVENYPDIISTQKVGFMGHSFGGGASFALGYEAFVNKGWGEQGRFIFAMAQWYSYQVDNTKLANFPANTKLITEVYDDDVTNDHRMAIDIFNHINIPAAEKDFITIKKSVINGYAYIADHVLPNTQSAYDAYDYYGIYRLLDAMIDYSFNGSAAGKKVALGNGSPEQVTMPSFNGQAMEPLVVTDNPVPLYPQSKYQFFCAGSLNPRPEECR